MRIGIDASRTVVAQRTGTENYSLHLIRHLLALGKLRPQGELHFTLYFNQRPGLDLLPKSALCRWRMMPFPRLWTHLRLSWEMTRQPPDVLFVPAHVLPLVHPPRSVVTIHDLGYLHHPASYQAGERLYLRLSTHFSARFATHLIADSKATKADLVQRLGVNPAKVSVIYPAAAKVFQPQGNETVLAELRRRLGLAGDYLLHVGTLKPRKNLGRLLSAFRRLRREAKIDLVLVGKPGGFALEPGDGIVEAGYRDDEELAALMQGATALVIPSLFEGFGLPALEAMACGTPVVAANTSSLPELVGEAAVLVDPLSEESIFEGMARLLHGAQLRQDLRERGLKRAQLFSWQRAAEETLAVLEMVSQAR